MKFIDYLKDRIYIIILNILCMISLSLFLLGIGNSMDNIILMLIFWIIIVSIYFIVIYMNRKKYFNNLFNIINELDNKYLLSEVIKKPYLYEDKQYYKLLKMCNKSMVEHVTIVKNERKEYKEYVEQWVHEIKTPIAAMKLICDNNKDNITRRIITEIDKTDNYIEQALFYARSENVEADYVIKEISLKKCINNVVIKNKQILIQNKVSVAIEETNIEVFSDTKWIEFILNQLLINSIKYAKEDNPQIKFYVQQNNQSIHLTIEDNGIGISKDELPRIFEKGFTGSKGRNTNKSTGIGLYLCEKLCDKLGTQIKAESKINEYTKVTIIFPA